MSLVRVAGLCELNEAIRRKRSDQAGQLQSLLTVTGESAFNFTFRETIEALMKLRSEKMTTRADLFREYARMIEMCEGTTVRPKDCVRYSGLRFDEDPTFVRDFEAYSFALAIVENKPVFEGNELYVDGERVTVTGTSYLCGESVLRCRGMAAGVYPRDLFSWNPPKPKTVTLTDLPKPLMFGSFPADRTGGYRLTMTFDTDVDRDAWAKALTQ